MYSVKGGMLLCVALLALAASRGLAQTDANCQAVSSLEMKVESGDCKAESSSYCTASAESTSQYREAFEEWFGGYQTKDYYTNRCNQDKVEAAAKAVATAIASVYTNAYVGIKCTEGSEGHTCGWSQANGDAWALATAQAVANAVADAGADNAKGFCYADVEAISAVVADVAADALADGCVKGAGSKYEFGESYQTRLEEGIAKAFATAFASACDSGDEATAESKCTGEGSSKTRSESSGDGDGYNEGGRVPPCTGTVDAKCCDRNRGGKLCTCSVKAGCQRGAYKLTSDYTDDQLRSWVAPDGKKCVCSN